MSASCYTLVASSSGSGSTEYPSAQELRSSLEKGSDEVKLETLRKIIVSTVNGVDQPTLLMPIIQFILPSKYKPLKKLLHFYWEVCPKFDADGKLKQEMILVVNAIRNDLQHPNEYIRGATLRFISKLVSPAGSTATTELLEPLIPTIRAALEHRHSYVRKNAIFALYSVWQAQEEGSDAAHLIPDAPELVGTFLAAETDNTCKRNGFVFLAACAQDKAIQWVFEQGVRGMDEGLLMAFVELVRKAVPTASELERKKFLGIIFTLLEVESAAVRFEAANLICLGAFQGIGGVGVKAAAQTHISLVQTQSDNNVKLIVLNTLERMYDRTRGRVLDGLVGDLLACLPTSGSTQVRQKLVAIVLKMTSSRNVEEVVTFLKKQLLKTRDTGDDGEPDAPEYRQLLIQSIHTVAIKFSEVAAGVVGSLIEFLGHSGPSTGATSKTAVDSALDVVSFVRELLLTHPSLRQPITTRLVQALPTIRSGKVFRGVLWILGEYVSGMEEVESVLTTVKDILGGVPIVLEDAQGPQSPTADGEKEKPKPKVLADGTYATESMYTAPSSTVAAASAAKAPLKALIVGGDYFTATVLAGALTKLILRYSRKTQGSKERVLRAQAMITLTSIIRVGQSPLVSTPIDEDSVERIMNCLTTLSTPTEEAERVFLEDTNKAFQGMVGGLEKRAHEKKESTQDLTASKQIQVDDLLRFSQFSKGAATGALADDDVEVEFGADGEVALGGAGGDFISDLKRVVQLTGFSDPIYAEALVKMVGFDIMLDVLLVNQTPHTLQNLCLDFSTLGDLKIVTPPTTYTIPPHGFQSLKTHIKVSSTETGVVFGSIIYEGSGAAKEGGGLGEKVVILADIHVDVMDYIKPAWCGEAKFRSMWTEFEWENRVSVNSSLGDPLEYLAHVMKATNMACLTPLAAVKEGDPDCGFLSANLYARSLFGEDALANLSIELATDADGNTKKGITGHVRIRSKTQGIALSLGDRITTAQKDDRPMTI